MAGPSPARRFDVGLACAADDERVRRLLREHALPGDVALTFEREPDSTIAAAIEGDVHQTIVARGRNAGEIAGIASRAERDVFLNGRPARLGYLGQLRADLRGHRVAALLDDGFAFCRTLHEQGNVAALSDRHCRRQSRRAAAVVWPSIVFSAAFLPSGTPGDNGNPPRAGPDAFVFPPASRSGGDLSSSCRTSWRVSTATAAATSSRRAGRSKICFRQRERPDSSRGIFSSRSPVAASWAVRRRGISARSNRWSYAAIRGGSLDGGAFVNLAGP